MDPMEINDERSLRAWLSDKPGDWAQSIALRAALRALPYIGVSRDSWLKDFALLPFGAVVTSWIQLAENLFYVRLGTGRANARFGGQTFDFAGYKEGRIAAMAANVSYHSADAQSQSIHVFSDCAKAVSKAAETFSAVAEMRDNWGENDDVTGDKLWFSIQIDCLRLSGHLGSKAASDLAIEPLWSGYESDWVEDWHKLSSRLRVIDPNYSVWIDWYERRIRGEHAAFGIPGDKNRIEHMRILRKLTAMTNEDFWGKGHEYVNATLKGWLDEARARVAPPPPETVPPTPPQEPGATAYGVNAQGKLDRLPHSDQVHLRDVPDQRRSYADLLATASELFDEGQRLGPRLHPKLDRFLQSLPERFEDAEAYLVWRDGNALRRPYFAHQKVAKGQEPDPARLEAAVAEGLGGLLDLYNNFAFADDGIRAKDEARVSPQERANAEAEAAVARPLVEAILAAPDIATPEAWDDIAAEAANADLPADDPYGAQVLGQSNRVIRNWFSGLFGGAGDALKNPKLLGSAALLGLVGGAAKVIGESGTILALGVNYAPLIEFIAANGAALQSYVSVAFTSFPNLPDLIDRIAALWNRLRHGDSE